MNAKQLRRLIITGDVEVCPACNTLSAYCYDDADEESKPPVYHIPACSCFDWQCGKCGATLADANSAALAEVYTHSAPPARISKCKQMRLRHELADEAVAQNSREE